MKFRDETAEIESLLAEVNDAIPTVEVKADLLRDFLERVQSAETRLRQRIALLREREEARDTSRAPGGWARLNEVERIARSYGGAEFANLEATVGLLKHLFAAVRDGDQETALHYVVNIDSGWDDRPWEKEELPTFEELNASHEPAIWLKVVRAEQERRKKEQE